MGNPSPLAEAPGVCAARWSAPGPLRSHCGWRCCRWPSGWPGLAEDPPPLPPSLQCQNRIIGQRSQGGKSAVWLHTTHRAIMKTRNLSQGKEGVKSVVQVSPVSREKICLNQSTWVHFLWNLVLDSNPVCAHNLGPFCSSRKIENYSVQCCNTLYQTTNGFTAWKSNQHLHHLPLRPKNTSAGIIPTQGASNYLTPGLLDPSMDITPGDWFRNRKKTTTGDSEYQLEK